MDSAVLARSVKVVVGGPDRSRCTREMLLTRIVDALGGEKTALRSLWRTDPGVVWFCTVEDAAMAERLVDKKSFADGDIVLAFLPCNRRRIGVRIHWLPLWLKTSEIGDYFQRFGRVLRVEEEYQYSNVLKERYGTGVRRVEMEIREGDQHDIPYKGRICNRVCLITIQGRPPLCLKCGEIGHFRAQCPRQGPQSYAGSVRRQPVSADDQSQPAPGSDVEATATQATDQENQADGTQTSEGVTETSTPSEVPVHPGQQPSESSQGIPETPAEGQGAESSQHGLQDRRSAVEDGMDDDSGDDSDSDDQMSEDQMSDKGSQETMTPDATKKLWTALRKTKRKQKKVKRHVNKLKELHGGDIPVVKENKMMKSLLSPASSQLLDPSVVSLERGNS